jgi:putative ABC transport system permease protein
LRLLIAECRGNRSIYNPQFVNPQSAIRQSTILSRAALISERYARQRFGAPTGALGRTLRFFNRSVPIVGVLPASFDFPAGTDVWFTAIGNRSQHHRRGNNFCAIARLKTDVGLEQA